MAEFSAAPVQLHGGSTLVTWLQRDALPQDFRIVDTLARGNLVHASHGVAVDEHAFDDDGAGADEAAVFDDHGLGSRGLEHAA